MPYSLVFDTEEKLIKITMQGTVNLPMVTKLASEVAEIAKEHNCFLILNDAREAIPDISVIGIHDLPKIFSEILSSAGIQISKFKRAIVVSKNINDFNFFETVSRNRAQNVMLFRDIHEAKKWLFEK